jgi:hypothetical protein
MADLTGKITRDLMITENKANDYAGKLEKEMAEIRETSRKVLQTFGDQQVGRDCAAALSNAEARTGAASAHLHDFRMEARTAVTFVLK